MREIRKLIDRMMPILHGRRPEIQGAVLADLTAIWLAGHVIRDDPVETAKLRAEIFSYHIRAIAELIDINADSMGTKLAAATPKGRA